MDRASLKALLAPKVLQRVETAASEWILDGIFSVAKSGSPDVELHVLEGWGHLDVLVGERSAEQVQAPLARWLAAHGL